MVKGFPRLTLDAVAEKLLIVGAAPVGAVAAS
jgi:hypothetical protein